MDIAVALQLLPVHQRLLALVCGLRGERRLGASQPELASL